ncbi:hypothetical protein AAEP93_007865 [Penicillium crustosum]
MVFLFSIHNYWDNVKQEARLALSYVRLTDEGNLTNTETHAHPVSIGPPSDHLGQWHTLVPVYKAFYVLCRSLYTAAHHPPQASLNISKSASTGESPHKLMFGVELRMPWHLLRQAAMVFHVKLDYAHTNLKVTPPSTVVEPIMFLSRLLTPAEKHYWETELEVSCIVWVVRKIRHMIEAALENLSPVRVIDSKDNPTDALTETLLKVHFVVKKLNS